MLPVAATRAARVGAFALAAAMAPLVPATSAVAKDDAASLIADAPSATFQPTDDGGPNGPIDGRTLIELTGTSPDKVSKAMRAAHGEARSWRDTDGSTVLVVVMTGDDASMTSEMLKGALDTAKSRDYEEFNPGLAGTAGFRLEKPGTVGASMLWRQDNYFVEIVAMSTDAIAPATETAIFFAYSQAAFLRSTTGAEPTLDTSSAASTTETSIAYQLGRAIGTVALAGIVIVAILNRRRRRDAQRAHAASYAIPPPSHSPAPLDGASRGSPTAEAESGWVDGAERF